ncbi:hypothetical protein ONE63_010349 [Megalurothrips usitatus]|uniref:Uncharacterized protein n=1 Tax=Megalurothrips usitatus TaxID=439358 RepID=A0AAV7XL20_9NEOP|nr:hypothetical protein ONE63_010349 [Megalurothrips usitatus]
MSFKAFSWFLASPWKTLNCFSVTKSQQKLKIDPRKESPRLRRCLYGITGSGTANCISSVASATAFASSTLCTPVVNLTVSVSTFCGMCVVTHWQPLNMNVARGRNSSHDSPNCSNKSPRICLRPSMDFSTCPLHDGILRFLVPPREVFHPT